MLENVKKPVKRAKGGGRKPLSVKEREARRKRTKDDYRAKNKQFSCVLSVEVCDDLRRLRAKKGVSFDILFKEFVDSNTGDS